MYICNANKSCKNTNCYHAKPHEWNDLEGCGNNSWCHSLLPQAMEFINSHPEIEKPIYFKTPVAKLTNGQIGGILKLADTHGAQIKMPACEEIQ